MSRSSHLRQMQLQQQQQMADNEAAALAAEIFDHFCVATTMRQVLGLHRNMCDTVGLRPGPLNEFYPKLKSKIRSWKAQALWKKFDARAAHRAYSKGNACTGTRVLVIGAGPCGLRTAIEAQLLGAKVVVVEKRDRISRNNVLHLWPFVITDLRNLGAKKFYGKFCAGSIDHISIRQLQCILLKVALLLGVEVHEGVSFENTIEPSDGCGWRAQVSPEDHAVSHYEFDVLIGADGKRNTLEAFKRKEFRGKLAIAITANFINKKTEAEAKAEEISGVAFIFNQSFFKELYATTGIDLENIVYYKDETHYFVMTAKKHSLIDKGVIIQDFADPAELLAPGNVNTDKLLDYAREAAEFSTKYQMPNLEFAVNHYGKPDVAMFDFTSMFAAETSCRVIVRKNYRLLQCLVGDSLLEPFWPTGSGCARGFLSSMDSAYAIKLWTNPKNSILGVLAQRESIYRLLAQTTPENLHRDIGAYTVDPATRYPNLNKSAVNVWQVKHLVDTDDKAILEQVFMDTNAMQAIAPETPIRRKRRTGDTLPLSTVLLRWIKAQLHGHDFSHSLTEVSECFTAGKVLCALINRYRPDLVDLNEIKDFSPLECNELAFKILENELSIPRVMSAKDSINLENVDSKIWLNYLEQICEVFRGEIPHVKHPKLDFAELKEKCSNNAADFSRLLKMSSRKAKSPMQDIDVANVIHRRSVLDEEKLKRQRKHGTENTPVVPVDTSRRARKRRSQEKSSNIDRERGIPSALPRGLDENFSDRIKSMEQRITSRGNASSEKKPKDLLRAIGKIESTDWNIREIEKKIEQSKKTESGRNKEKVPKWSKEQFLARQHKMAKPERQESTEEKFKEIDQTLKNFDKQLKEGSVLEVGERGRNKVASIAGQFVKKDDASEEKIPIVSKSNSKVGLVFNKQAASEKCHFCKQTVYLMEKISTEGLILHRSCLKCYHCHTNLRLGAYAFDRDDPIGRFYCTQHFRLPAKAVRPVVRRPSKRKTADHAQAAQGDHRTPIRTKGRPENIAQLDMLDRGQTPERIEFENADAMSDGEPSLENIIDENEWTDRNFLSGSDDLESDLSSSDSSDDDSDSDMFEEANGSPIGAQTLQLATDWIGKQRYSNMDDSDEEDFYDSSEGLLDDDADSQTEGEEFKKAREMRRQEVKLLPPPAYLPTDTETEVVSKEDIQQIDKDKNSSDKISDNITPEVRKDKNNKIGIIGSVADKSENVARQGEVSKTDIKIIERDLGRRVSTDIDALSENLYYLNNLIKLNKDVDTIKKDYLVKDDIMKKLSLKEKWLKDLETGSVQNVKSRVQEKADMESVVENVMKVNLGQNGEESMLSEEIDEIDEFKINSDSVEGVEQEQKLVLNRSSPKENQKESDDANKRDKYENLSATNNNKKDIGKCLYDIENKFSPKGERKMSTTLKKIEVKNFSDTMDSIKSQISSPKISKQSSLDLSKYFPNQKAEKAATAATNKNQKTLKDVDLTQYFPQSPVNQRKGSLTPTVTSKQSPGLTRKSESKNPETSTSKALTNSPTFGKCNTPKNAKSKSNVLHQPVLNQNILSKEESVKAIESKSTKETSTKSFKGKKESELSMFDQLLDGALDVKYLPIEKESPKTEKKIKRTVPKKGNHNSGQKLKQKKKMTAKDKDINNVLDVNEQIFEEILKDQNERSPSLEYKKLFNEEKSPSADISEKIENILKEPVENLSIGRNSLKRKKLIKANKILDEDNLVNKPSPGSKKFKEDGIEPSTEADVIEQKKSVSPPVRQNKSSKQNQEKRNSLDFMCDFEKTMEYLKSEWRSEATNFMQSKRDSFFAKSKSSPESKKNSFEIVENPKELISETAVSDKSKSALEDIVKESKVVVDDTVVDEILQEIMDEVQVSELQSTKSSNDIIINSNNESHEIANTDKNEVQDSRIIIEPSKNDLNKVLNDIESNNYNEDTDKVVPTQPLFDSGCLKESSLEEININSIDNYKISHNVEITADILKNSEIEEVINKKIVEAKVSVSPSNIHSKESDHDKSYQHKLNEEESLFSDTDVDNIDVDEILNEMKNELGNSPQDERKSVSISDIKSSTERWENNSNSDADLTGLSNSESIERKISEEKEDLITNNETVASVQDISSKQQQNLSPNREKSSSEEDSIEKLFSQFRDDMLVDVEFDSNEEIVSITPRCTEITKDKNSKILMEVLEREDKEDKEEKAVITDLNDVNKNSSEVSPKKHFPIKPVRKNKSVSSSRSPSLPSPPPRRKNQPDLSRLNPIDMPPSVQDILRNIQGDENVYFMELNDIASNKFPMVEQEDCALKSEISPSPKLEDKSFESEMSPSPKLQDKSIESEISPSPKLEDKSIEPEISLSPNLEDKSIESKISPSPKLEDNSIEKEKIDDWEYIETLEKERRAALIKRDELYAMQNKPITLAPNQESHRNPFQLENGINESVRTISRSDNNISYPKVPPRSPKSKRKIICDKNVFKNSLSPEKLSSQIESSDDNKGNSMYSSIGLSKSSEHIPQRPSRRKSADKEAIDGGTQLLLERSKMLHSLKQEFMNEKIVGNNPYLKKVIKKDKTTAVKNKTKSSNNESRENMYSHFPTSRTIENRKHQRNNSDFSDAGRRTPNLASSLGPRNFVEYFKRSPPKSKELETPKDSCILS